MADNSLFSRLKNAAKSVFNTNNAPVFMDEIHLSYGNRSPSVRSFASSSRSVLNTINNRIAVDVSEVAIRQVVRDANGSVLAYKNSGLNECLTIEANTDQTGKAFIIDTTISMLDEGVVGIVPTYKTERGDILALRTAKILKWYPSKVEIEVYNDITGKRARCIVDKSEIAIIENPFYSIMNTPNSTLKRLNRKIELLDITDNNAYNGKLDLILSFPYLVKTDIQKNQAAQRIANIEKQLKESRYGLAYTDGTEKITQLNRSIENNLQPQIEYLTKQLKAELGITDGILDGTADEQTLNNYMQRVIAPIVEAICDGLNKAFITKTARTQGTSIWYSIDPFKLVSLSTISGMIGTLKQSEILSSNEIRTILGRLPDSNPRSDQLINSNINTFQNTQDKIPDEQYMDPVSSEEIQNE